MSIFIKPGYWDEKAKAPKHWLNLEQYIRSFIPATTTTTSTTASPTSFKILKILVTKEGSSPIVVETLENTLVGTVTVTGDGTLGAAYINVNCVGAFPDLDKVFTLAGNVIYTGGGPAVSAIPVYFSDASGADDIYFSIFDLLGTGGGFTRLPIEIKVYN